MVKYSERIEGTVSEVKQGLYRFQASDEDWYYGHDLDSIPEEYRKGLREDFKAASIVLDSVEDINVPEVKLDYSDDCEIFMVEDMGIGETNDKISFYEAAGFHLLMSKSDVERNIVEGCEGYSPVDFEAFLRAPLDEDVIYVAHGARYDTDQELYRSAVAYIEREAERHGIDFSPEKLEEATKSVAEVMDEVIHRLREENYGGRADNLKRNTELVIGDDIFQKITW